MTLDTQMNRIALYESGSMSVRELNAALIATWAGMLAVPETRDEIAAKLGVPLGVVAALPAPPFTAKVEHADIDVSTATVAIAAWIASEVLLGALKDLAKDEVKWRLLALWAVLEPRLRSRLPTPEALGNRIDDPKKK